MSRASLTKPMSDVIAVYVGSDRRRTKAKIQVPREQRDDCDGGRESGAPDGQT
jgi:hypothetical protein